jgi:hypothetical protein
MGNMNPAVFLHVNGSLNNVSKPNRSFNRDNNPPRFGKTSSSSSDLSSVVLDKVFALDEVFALDKVGFASGNVVVIVYFYKNKEDGIE